MASQALLPQFEGGLQGVPPVIMQAMQMMQQLGPKPPGDPTQILMAETQRKAQADQVKAQLDQQKLELDQVRLGLEAQNTQSRMQQAQLDLQAKAEMNREDNTTAKELAVFEAEQGHKTNLTTGHGINPHV
jgi:hypothetical protein